MSYDAAYYRHRANTERVLALKSERQNVAEIHAELARLYGALSNQEKLRPPPSLVKIWYERLSA